MLFIEPFATSSKTLTSLPRNLEGHSTPTEVTSLDTATA